MNCGITGKLFVVIYNLYKEAKSCIKRNMHISEFFACLIGVRQGENLSPLLFSIFLHDLKKHLSKSYGGLQNIDQYLADSTVDCELYMNIFLLLYADDTVILAESEVELQKAINSLFEFCRHNKLQINTSKSKIMVFSRGKIRKKTHY